MFKLKEIAQLRFDAARTLIGIASAAGVARSMVQFTLQEET